MSKRLLVLLTAALLATSALSAGCGGVQITQEPLPSETLIMWEEFPFEGWDKLARSLVDDQGRVDYTRLKKDPTELRVFTNALASAGPSNNPTFFPSPEHKMAYFINGYNGLAMLGVIARYPDIKDLDSILKQKDFFYDTDFKIDGKMTNLYDLENKVVRPMFKKHYVDAGAGAKFGRVHFALNCASASCPQLPAEAFLPAQLEGQLERETRKFVMESRNVSVNDDKKRVRLSKIFEWYAEDFTDNSGKPISQLAWINMYRPEDKQIDTSYEIEFFDYDWTLNDQKLYK